MKQVIKKFRDWYHNLPEKKKYVEFISALLTIPVLMTVILINFGSLAERNKSKQPLPTTTPTQTVIPIQIIKEEKLIPITTIPAQSTQLNPTSSVCNKNIPPIEIVSPQENEVVMKDSVCVNLRYDKEPYCAIVWSQSINGGSWTDFSDKAYCFLNLTKGPYTIDVKVKSIVTGEETNIRRSFIFDGPSSIVPTGTATQSAY